MLKKTAQTIFKNPKIILFSMLIYFLPAAIELAVYFIIGYSEHYTALELLVTPNLLKRVLQLGAIVFGEWYLILTIKNAVIDNKKVIGYKDGLQRNWWRLLPVYVGLLIVFIVFIFVLPEADILFDSALSSLITMIAICASWGFFTASKIGVIYKDAYIDGAGTVFRLDFKSFAAICFYSTAVLLLANVSQFEYLIMSRIGLATWNVIPDSLINYMLMNKTMPALIHGILNGFVLTYIMHKFKEQEIVSSEDLEGENT